MGQANPASSRIRARQNAPCDISQVFLAQAFGDVFAHRIQECVGHAPADNQQIDPFHQMLQDSKLGGHFRTANNGSHRAFRIAKG